MLKSLRYFLQYSFLALIVTLVAHPLMAQANEFIFDPPFSNSASKPTNLQNETQLGTNDPAGIVFTVVNTALIFLGAITVVMFIVAGFMWIFAAGDEEDIEEAKDLIKGAVFGLIIVLGSYGLAQFVFAAIRIATQGK